MEKRWTSQFLEKDGNKIHYYKTNSDGSPVFLLHGATDNGLCWTPTALKLQEQFDVIMPDSRAHGLTEINDGLYSYHAMASDINDLIDELKLKEVVLIGHSMGASLATLTAATYPDNISKVILEDPAFILRNPNFITRFFTRIFMSLGNLFLLRGTFEELIKKCKKRDSDWPEEAYEPWARSKLEFKKNEPKGLQEIIKHPFDWKEIIPQISCPILLLTSEKGITSKKKAKKIMDLAQKGKHVRIMGAGHNIRREKFDKYIREVFGFLSEEN